MAKYNLEIGGANYEVEAPDNATPDVMRQIAATILDSQKMEQQNAVEEEALAVAADPNQQVMPITPSVDEATTTTLTSDDPRTRLRSAGWLPSLVRAGSGMLGGAVAGVGTGATMGGATVPSAAAGAAIASAGEALAQGLDNQSFEGYGEGYSPNRIGMAAPLALIPVKNAKTIGKALKAGLGAGAATTAGISAADYWDSGGELPTMDKVGPEFLISSLMGVVGSRVGGAFTRDTGLPIDNPEYKGALHVPPDRLDELKELEEVAKTSTRSAPPMNDPVETETKIIRRKNKQKAKAAGQMTKTGYEDDSVPPPIPPNKDKAAVFNSEDEFEAKMAARIRARAERIREREKSLVVKPDDKVREALATEGVSVRGDEGASHFARFVQEDLGVVPPERTPPPREPDWVSAYLDRLSRNEQRTATTPIGWRGNWGLRPQAAKVRDLSQASGLNGTSDYMHLERQVELKRQFEDVWAGKGNPEDWGLTRIFRRTGEKSQRELQSYLMAPDKEEFLRNANWKPDMVQRGEQLEKFYRRFLNQFGVDSDEFFQKWIPTYRLARETNDVDLLEGLPDEMLPFLEDESLGLLDFLEPNGLKAAARFLRSGSFRKFLAPKWEEMNQYWNQVATHKSSTPLQKQLAEEMRYTMSQIRGTHTDKFYTGLQDLLNGITEKLGMPGFKLNAEEAVDNLLQAQNMAYLGGNLPSLVRDAFQPILTAFPRLGTKHFMKGLKLAMSKAGKKAAEDAGITKGMTTGLHDALAITKGPVGRGMRAVSNVMMAPRQWNESFGRSWAFNGMVSKAQDALDQATREVLGPKGKTIRGSSIDLGDRLVDVYRRFADLADIDRMHPETQKEIAGAFFMKSPEEAIEAAARSFVNETMFDYTSMGRAYALQTGYGKVGATYGVWPTAYAEYLSNMNKYGPAWKRGRDWFRLVVAHGAVAGTFGGLGIMAGDTNALRDAMTSTLYAPTIPGVSGVGNLMMAGLESAKGVPGAEREMKYTASGMIPGAAMYRNIKDIAGESSYMRKVGRAAGFVRGRKKEDGAYQVPKMKTIKNPNEQSLFRRLFPNPF